MSDADAQLARQGVHHLEGYLFWRAETEGARRAGTEFAAQFDWMTTGQREAVSRAYAAAFLDVSRDAVCRIADRTREIRDEYAERERALKVRLTGIAAGTAALMVLLAVLGVLV